MTGKWHGGKGSKYREIKNKEQFDAEWDRIFVRKKTPKQGATKTHVDKTKYNRKRIKIEDDE
jgi:hypothetical protein